MEGKEYSELNEEIEGLLREGKQRSQILDSEIMRIEETLRKRGFFGPLRKFLEPFKDQLQVWERVSERIGIPREERSHVVLGAILVIASEETEEKQ